MEAPAPEEGSSRRTRSQVAPDWSARESLILVNEIAAIEGECGRTLSSFQKWKIIAGNCNALDVSRTLDQCRRKWDSLLSLFNNVKRSESTLGKSYCALDNHARRQVFGFVPEDIDSEVYKAIDDHLKADEESDTDPDNDPEAVADAVSHVLPLLPDSSGFKKRRSDLTRRRHIVKERVTPTPTPTPPQKRSRDKQVVPEQSSEEEKVKPPKHGKCEQIRVENNDVEEKEQAIAAELLENVEQITATLRGNLDDGLDFVSANLRNAEASEMAFRRRQGDQLITRLVNLSDTLAQLCDLVQGCH
ncbi:uncharacterized protein LOC127813664 isoform X2 [Diospyros lotus]|uniref:uncharacterized protein LOC127813664 isoform X2 n=1 Tax=Diospyros lotus TaxID=55363 RepID=UPI0022553E6F|nr:uncharacterized protein LOC127813664 isoform X2 [Diospyros lotus]